MAEDATRLARTGDRGERRDDRHGDDRNADELEEANEDRAHEVRECMDSLAAPEAAADAEHDRNEIGGRHGGLGTLDAGPGFVGGLSHLGVSFLFLKNCSAADPQQSFRSVYPSNSLRYIRTSSFCVNKNQACFPGLQQ